MARPESGPPQETEFDSFFMAHYHWILGAVSVVTGTGRDAEDAVQEAFTRAYRDWDRVATHPRPDLWVLRVARNTAISNWRKRSREMAFDQGESASPIDSLIKKEWLTSALDGLSPQQRASFVLHHAEGFPVTVVAERLRTSQSSVKTHLVRARARLRRALGGELER
jgi:RNA polymerase sigma-70 factor (ECF subfamily)